MPNVFFHDFLFDVPAFSLPALLDIVYDSQGNEGYGLVYGQSFIRDFRVFVSSTVEIPNMDSAKQHEG